MTLASHSMMLSHLMTSSQTEKICMDTALQTTTRLLGGRCSLASHASTQATTMCFYPTVGALRARFEPSGTNAL